MKILIITYFKEINPGTFLQAYGVQYAYRLIFPSAEIVYLDYKKVIKEIKQGTVDDCSSMSFLQKFVHVLSLRSRKRKFMQEQYRCFVKSKHCYELFPQKEDLNRFEKFANSFDIVSVGSDTILESMVINSNIGLMWLSERIKANKVFFAASADTATNFSSYTSFFDEIRKSIESFKSIGIRDQVTRNFFIEKLGVPSEKIEAQPDPTFFLPLSLFELPEGKRKSIPHEKKTIFYHMDRRFKFRKELANLLKSKGYFLFTSEYDPNCDLSFKSLTPFEWAALFGLCDFVITERFHDTVFSMRYGTPVITCEWYSGIISKGVSSKRESIAKDFDNLDNYFRIGSVDDLVKVSNRLEKIDTLEFKDKARCKVHEMQATANVILNQIKESCQEF